MEKKIVSTLLTCLFIIPSTFSQAYISYHRLIVQAEEFIVEEDYHNALNCYLCAISSVEYAFTKDVYNAAICAAIEDDTTIMFALMEKCLKQGVDFSMFEINRTVFSRFYLTQQWNALKNERENYKKVYQNHVVLPYKKTLDSLDILDQKARSRNMAPAATAPANSYSVPLLNEAMASDRLMPPLVSSTSTLFGQ